MDTKSSLRTRNILNRTIDLAGIAFRNSHVEESPTTYLRAVEMTVVKSQSPRAMSRSDISQDTRGFGIL